MRKVALVLLALLGVLVMHAAPMVPPAVAGHATHAQMALAGHDLPAPVSPPEAHHQLDPCTAVLPSSPALQPMTGAAGAVTPAVGGTPCRTAVSLSARASRSHAPPDLHALCICRT